MSSDLETQIKILRSAEDLKAARAEAKLLRSLLIYYGRHTESCDASKICTCGWTKLRPTLEDDDDSVIYWGPK